MKRSKLLTIPRAATRMLPAPTHLRRLFVALVVLLTMTAQTAMAAITGSGTADDPYLISSTEDWNTFANNLNNGTSYSGQTVKLNADISVTTMVGTWDNPFNGTFDGGGHTLSVTLNNDSQYGYEDAYYGVAPFRFTNGATIQFLVVTGIVTTSTRKYAAGLIGMTKGGTNTIMNCISSVEIFSTIALYGSDFDGTHGGFIGKASGTVIINNCLFNGQLTTISDNPTINCGGFVGWRDGTLSISNSLYAPNTTIPSGKTAVNVGATFSRNDVTPTNSYYTQTLGAVQGTAVGSKTATQLVADLGSAWRVSGGRAVPKLLLSTKSFTIAKAAGTDYCGTITYGGNDFLVPDAHMMQNQLFEGKITMRSKMTGNEGTVKLYPRMSGKVKSLTFSSARVTFSDVVGTEHYVKIGKGDIWTNSYTEDMNKATALTFTFTNDEGLQLANEDDYLEIKMRNSESTRNASLQDIGGKITITYEPTEATETHRHNFTYIVEDNTLTATCAHDDGKECNLASSSYKISTSLIPPTNLTFNDGWFYSASMSGFESFRSETKATIGSITYIKTDTNEDYGTSEPNAIGTYSASVTINADNYPYTLTTSYRVTDFNFIHINYPQFTTDKAENNYVGDGETVTLTFTPKFGETLTGLTVTGATTNMSIGSGITSIGNNKYTFTMPAEDVTIGATFTAPDASHFEQNGDAYTIKTANGWGWFCFVTNYDLAPDGFSGKTVKLAGNVSSSEMAGTSGHPFKGTFDGQNYTLTFNRTAAEHFCAPFHYINGATISNLHVEGTITGDTYENLGGLVGRAEGNITINNCHVSTEISTTVSGSALHGGVIAQWNGTNATCTVTGCVYDGLIYNPDQAGVTTSCHGFIGWDYGNKGTITFTDCLSAPAAYGTGKYALGDNCFTFVYPNSEPTLTYNMTNCYYTSILGNRQGRPAATATTAPGNLGNATTDHGMVDGYENGFLYDGNYYTPKYGDATVEYRFNDWNERADVTINGTGENLVGVNITEEVGNIKSVTYNRPFTAAQASTVILPFNYICNGNEGGKFYSFAGISVTAPIVEDGNHVTSLTANTPYLFVPTATTMTFPNISSMTGGVVTLQPTTGDHKVTSDDKNWTLVGSYSIKTWVTEIDKAYFINDEGELKKIVSGMITAPTECYLLTVIDAKDIAQATVTGMKSLYSHTGSAISLGYTVTAFNSSTPLTKGTDFTETITKGGTTVTNVIDEGNYTLTITGKSPYFGSQSFDFTVGDYIPMTNTTTVMNNCLYGVKENITISDRIVVIGDVTLTLEEGCTLTAQHGIEVEAGNTLTIDGTGSLTIPTGGNYCAGIGSNNGKEYGHIIINGGIITTEGGQSGAGIGGGYENVDNGNCSITINGGVINATGRANAAGIGGGYGGAHNNNPRGAAGTIIINGGQVTALQKSFSGSSTTHCGIGHGYMYSGGGGSLTLDWTRESDFINCFKYNITNINFGGKDFVLDEDNTVAATISNIDGNKIIPKLDNLVLNHATINNLCSLYRYTGSEIALGYTIKSTDGTTTLVKGTDYSETIKKGGVTSIVKDKGEYTLTITGLGDYYTGTKSYTFSVADIDEDLTQDGSEYYVNFPADGSTKTVNLIENQTIKVYDSEGKNGSLVTCDGYLLLQAPDGYALEVMGKTDAMKYNEVNSSWVNSLSAYEGDNTSNEIINLLTNSDNILFASGGKVMRMRLNVTALYTFASQYGLDLTVRVIPQQSYTITKGTVSNGSIDIADNKTTATTNEMITLTVNPAEDYLLKRLTITDTDGGSTLQTIGEDQWYSGENTVSFKMPSRNVTITPEFTNSLTAAGGLSMNIDLSGTKECVIPEIVQSFNIRASAVDNPTGGSSVTIILKAHNEYRLQATGQIEFTNVSTDDGEISIYDGANTSATLLTNIKGASKDKVSIGTQTSSSNYMTIYLSEEDIYNSVFTGTIETQIKNYSITYDLAGGSVATENPTTYNYKTDAFTLTNPTREGYTFAGWTGTGLDAASTSVTIAKGSTGVRSYTATWNIITYNITYNNAVNGTDGVTNSNPATYTIESEAITLADPSKTGYVFAGWFSDAEFNTPATTTIAANSTGDKTFWAKWTRPITSEGITISVPSQEWTGSELTFDPSTVVVKDGETTLVETTDYTVTAPSGTIQNAGDYSFTITGAGNYSGTREATFTIVSKPVTVKNDQNEDVPAATGDATITQDQKGTTLTLITPAENVTPQTVSIPTAVEVDHVEIERTFTSEKASTVYLPFSIAAANVRGGKFYTFTDVDETTTPWTVKHTEVTGNIEANTPYIFLPDGSNSGKIEVDNGSNKISVCTANPHTTTQGQWEFIGTYAPITWTSGDTDLGKVYGFAAEDKTDNGKNIAAGQFVKVAAGASIAPMRAYLKRTPSSSGAARMRGATDELPETMNVVLISASGEATTIGTITLSNDTDEWYSLDGRKLSGKPTKKGLYIRNGKKIVVK